MLKKSQIMFMCLILAGVVGLCAPAWAARADAQGGEVTPFVPATGGGTLDLVAYSHCIHWVNANTWDSRLGKSAGAPGGTIVVTRWEPGWPLWPPSVSVTTYLPVVGFRGRGKPVPPANEFVRSTSHTAGAKASYLGGAATPSLSVTTWVPADGDALEAAGEAVDPISLDIGVYDYSWMIDDIELEALTEGEYAKITMWATDSRFEDPLWALGVAASGPIESINDVSIGFYSNPILGLDDGLVTQQLRDAFYVGGGGAGISNYLLFDTEYQVDVPIEYGDGVNAACGAPIPEPVTLLLFGLGIPMAISRRRG